MTRGVLYITWPGDPRTEAMLERSIESLQKWHPELPFHVERLESGATLLDKARMFDLSPFEETLFLDADTVVLGRLDHGFEKAAQHGLACCICECPWARRFGGLKNAGDIIEYNTGAIWFTDKSSDVFERWKFGVGMDSSIRFMRGNSEAVMPFNDQGPFAVAIHDSGFNPFVLPMNWNFRPMWHRSMFGPIKIWHDYSDVPQGIIDWNESQTADGAIVQYAEVAR
jgi:hypothetical protein